MLIVEALAAAFGAGAAVGWIVKAIQTHRPDRQNTNASPNAELVIRLMPDKTDLLCEWDKLTDAAELIIIISTDTRRESRR